jgi:hypothetical protein
MAEHLATVSLALAGEISGQVLLDSVESWITSCLSNRLAQPRRRPVTSHLSQGKCFAGVRVSLVKSELGPEDARQH